MLCSPGSSPAFSDFTEEVTQESLAYFCNWGLSLAYHGTKLQAAFMPLCQEGSCWGSSKSGVLCREKSQRTMASKSLFLECQGFLNVRIDGSKCKRAELCSLRAGIAPTEVAIHTLHLLITH